MSGNADLEAKIIDAIYRGACDAAELSRALVLIAEYFESPGGAAGRVGSSPAAQVIRIRRPHYRCVVFHRLCAM
jgi:hypothetical protein